MADSLAGGMLNSKDNLEGDKCTIYRFRVWSENTGTRFYYRTLYLGWIARLFLLHSNSSSPEKASRYSLQSSLGLNWSCRSLQHLL
jgi:hypothetical protein